MRTSEDQQMKSGAIFCVPADQKELSAIRDFLQERSSASPAIQREIDDLIQAVDEAASNIIMHGYQQIPGWIEIEFQQIPGKIKVYLRDDAPPFDPTKVPPPNIHLPLNKRRVGGLGIYLIRQCVDEFSYCNRPNGGNQLLLVKCLGKKPNSTSKPTKSE